MKKKRMRWSIMNLNLFWRCRQTGGKKNTGENRKRDKGRTYPAWGRHPAVLGGKCTSGVDR